MPIAKTVWIVSEYEGYTDKLLETWEFANEAEALEFWQRRVDMNKYAGVGGKWKHYFSYPQQKQKEQVS